MSSKPDAILEDGTMLDFKLSQPREQRRLTTAKIKSNPLEFARMVNFDVCGSVSIAIHPPFLRDYARLK